MAPIHLPYMICCWPANVSRPIVLSFFSSYLTLNSVVTLVRGRRVIEVSTIRWITLYTIATISPSYIISEIKRDIGRKSWVFIPHLHLMPCPSLNWHNVWQWKTRMVGYQLVENVWEHCNVYWLRYNMNVTDGQRRPYTGRIGGAMHSVARKKGAVYWVRETVVKSCLFCRFNK